jgi:phage terminase large subunit
MTAAGTPTKIRLPYKFTPRHYQIPLFKALDSGYTRAVVRWHRRAGKDKALINLITKKAFERVGVYFYVYPFYAQARKALWENIDKDGMRFMDHIPEELRHKTNNQEMMIELVNGSIIRIIGSDNPDSVVGTNPVGVVFSEFALQDPTAWYFLRPILAENGGWAVFNSTPRGANHFKDLWQLAERDPAFWFTQKLTVEDTKAIPQHVLDREKAEYFEQTGSDDLYDQEYMVSFEAAVQGSYFGPQMLMIERLGHITKVPWEPTIPVDTYWDLGVNDTTVIWFVQTVGKEIRVIDYLEHNGEGFPYYAKELKGKPYTYGTHYMPHDIEIQEIGTGMIRRQTAESLGIKPIKVVPRVKAKEESIDAARNILPRVWFDTEKCEKGINALRSYQKVWDEKNKVYRNTPLHNWASNGADGFQQLAMAYKPPADEMEFVEETLFSDEGYY